MKRKFSIVRKSKEFENKSLTGNRLRERYSNSNFLLKCRTEDGITCYASPGVKGWLRFIRCGIEYSIKKRIGRAE